MIDTNRITGAPTELGGKLQSAGVDLTRSDRDTVEGRFRAASGQVENAYGQAKDAARDVADQAVDYAEEAYEHAGDYVRRGSREIGHQVANYPLASLLVAGLVGFGIGLLVKSSRD